MAYTLGKSKYLALRIKESDMEVLTAQASKSMLPLATYARTLLLKAMKDEEAKAEEK